MTDYIITKEQCASHHKGKVCPGCGWDIEPLETVDNSGNPTFWSGCPRCCKFTTGFPVVIYEIAERLVSDEGFEPYCFETSHESQVSGASNLVRTIFGMAGINATTFGGYSDEK